MGPESQVRTRLGAGGKWIRTPGPALKKPFGNHDPSIWGDHIFEREQGFEIAALHVRPLDTIHREGSVRP